MKISLSLLLCVLISCGPVPPSKVQITITTTICPISDSSKCSIYGDSHRKDLQKLDSLKNRSANSSLTPEIFDFNDISSHNETKFIQMSGYIVKVKYGGPETCECHSKDKNDLDFHIVVAKDSLHTSDKECMIWEVTRINRLENPKLTYAYVWSLLYKQVTGIGWSFEDTEHKQSSEETNPGGKNNWRLTDWELHSLKNLYESKTN